MSEKSQIYSKSALEEPLACGTKKTKLTGCPWERAEEQRTLKAGCFDPYFLTLRTLWRHKLRPGSFHTCYSQSPQYKALRAKSLSSNFWLYCSRRMTLDKYLNLPGLQCPYLPNGAIDGNLIGLLWDLVGKGSTAQWLCVVSAEWMPVIISIIVVVLVVI